MPEIRNVTAEFHTALGHPPEAAVWSAQENVSTRVVEVQLVGPTISVSYLIDRTDLEQSRAPGLRLARIGRYLRRIYFNALHEAEQAGLRTTPEPTAEPTAPELPCKARHIRPAKYLA